jgi:hypothetical protein
MYMYVYIHIENTVWDVSSISAANIVHNKDQHRTIVQPGDAEQYTSGLNPTRTGLG